MAPPVIVLLAGLLVIPLAAVIGIAFWTRCLQRRGTVPRFAIHTAYGFVVLSGAIVAVAAGLVLVALGGRGGDTAVKRAAALAMGISEAMNDGAFGLLVAMVGAAWLAFCTWRWHPAKRRVVGIGSAVVLVIVVTLGVLAWREAHRETPLNEALNMVQSIRVAQESYETDTMTYANVSKALAANQSTNHFALYPQAPREPGKQPVAWGAKCPPSACTKDMDWSMLPIHVDGPVAFGYSTIAGSAGERPDVVVTIEGKPVEWPVPTKPWYIITAVGDPDGDGVFTTVLAASWWDDVRIDPGEK